MSDLPATPPSERSSTKPQEPGDSPATGTVASGAQPRAQRGAAERSQKVWTVLELLRWTQEDFRARGIATARLDAECLLAHALGVSRLGLYLEFERPVDADERARFRRLVERRRERVPVAQLTGRKEFWSLSLRVDGHVLTPRPETETLVAAALEALPATAARVLEVGTGSGAVALALAHERPAWELVASDVSEPALALARANAAELGLAERVDWRSGSLYEPADGERFDAVVANPPYVAESQREVLAPELAHEPEVALFGGPDGLDLLRALVAGAPARLHPGGLLALEHGAEQGSAVAAACREAGLAQVRHHRDLGGHVRVTTARAPLPESGGG